MDLSAITHAYRNNLQSIKIDNFDVYEKYLTLSFSGHLYLYDLKTKIVLYKSSSEDTQGPGNSILNVGPLNDKLKGHKVTYSS